MISLRHNYYGMPLKLLFLLVLSMPLINKGFGQTVSEDSAFLTNDLLMLLQDRSQGGTIQLYQDPSLLVLIEKNIRINEKEGLIGFRIQLYSGSGQNSREKVNDISFEFMKSFPDFNPRLIYAEYQAPYFKLQIGDYRSKNEAYEFYQQLKKKFPDCYIVKSRIKYPKIESVEK